MKYQDLVQQLKTNPSDDIVEYSKAWLSKKHKATKAALTVSNALLSARPDSVTLTWFGTWMEDKDWHFLIWATCLENFEIHDWIIDYVSARPGHPQVGQIWETMLGSYRYEKLINGAKGWFLKQALTADIVGIARHLLQLTRDPLVIRQAIQLSRTTTDSLLLKTLIEVSGDDSSIKQGVRVIEDPSFNYWEREYIAAALLKVDANTHWPLVDKFIMGRWKRKDAYRILTDLFEFAPLMVTPRALEWLELHPETDPSEIFIMAPLVDSEWKHLLLAWCRVDLDNRWTPKVFSLLILSDLPNESMADLLRIGDSWLEANPNHDKFETVLLTAMRAEVTPARLKFAHAFQATLTDNSKRGRLLMNLRRIAKEQFEELAMSWALKNPNNPESDTIQFESWSENSPETSPPPTHSRWNRFSIMCRQVTLGDPVAISQAKLYLTSSNFIERRYSQPVCCVKIPLLIQLLSATPSDAELLSMAENLLGTKLACPNHDEDLQKAYDTARRLNS